MPSFSITELIDKIQEYLKIKGEIIKLEALGYTAKVASYLISIFILLAILMFLGFFLGITLAVYLNHLLESVYLGYAIVSGIALLKLILILILLKTGKIQGWIEAIILKAGGDDEA